MLKNHFKSIFRSLKRNKGYSAINISGLAIGFAAAMLIAIYVNQEFTYDRHYQDNERIYRLSGRSFAFSSIAHLNYLQNNMAGVEAWVNVMPNPSTTIKYDNRNFIQEDTYYTTSEYLKVFKHDFVLGNPETALDDINALILTESLAKKIFGSRNPLDELVSFSSQMSEDTYKVTGVIKDHPTNTSLKFSALARTPQSTLDNIADSFSFTTGFSYFKMESPVQLESFQDQTDRLYAKRMHDLFGEGADFETFLNERRGGQPLVMKLTDIHLESDVQFEASPPGNKQYLYIFLSIALFIIILAGINYVNLATAQASKKAKEVGIRKVLGSFRSSLMTRFLAESVFLSFASVLLGLGLAEGALKLMSLTGFSNFDVNVYDYPMLIVITLVVGLISGLIAGIYPALYLTSFKPSTVLKGDYRLSGGSKLFRNGLVVFQFVVSLSLAVFSVFVYEQLNYGLNKELGFDKEGVIVIDDSKSQLGDDGENFEPFVNELRKISSVSNVSSSHFSMIGTLPLSGMAEIGGEETYHRFQYKYVDAAFTSTMGFEIVDGRDFDENLDGDREAIVINETFAKTLGPDLFEKRFNANFNGRNVRIVGVVKDFHYDDLNMAIGPTVFFKRAYGTQLNVRISGNDLLNTISQIESAYAQFTDEPLDYYFFDQKFNQLFESEKRISQIIAIFTGLSLFVALLGLIGLISYKLDQRIKEIGIRKVLGASIAQILSLFSKEMVRLVLLALVITVPLGFYATSRWLEGFAYHIEIGVLPFVLIAAFGVGITLLIVSLRTVKTASMNPVNALRDQ